MQNYIFAYHGGKKPETEEEGAKEMALWQAWFEAIGDSVVDPGNPVGKSYTVSASGVVTSCFRTPSPATISATASRHHCKRISPIIGSDATQGARDTSTLNA